MTRQEWVEKCGHWKSKWLVIQEEYLANNTDYSLNIYAVLDAINKHSRPEDILMGDAGSISYAGPVALQAKKGQRFIFSSCTSRYGLGIACRYRSRYG